MNKIYAPLVMLFFCALSLNASAQTNMYTVSSTDILLEQVDTTTMLETGTAVTLSVSTGTITGCNGLAVQPCTGDIFLVYKLSGVVTRRLGIVDPTTGVITEIGDLGDKVSGICFGDQNHLYAVTGDGASVSSTLYKVDIATAAMTFFTSYGNGDDGECIGFSTEDGRIYHWSGLSTPIMESTDTLTGTTINIPLSGYNYGEIRAATFIGNGTFFVGDGNFFMRANINGFITQDLAQTGFHRGFGFPISSTPPVISTVDPTSFCPGDSAVITVAGTGTYQWQLDGSPIAGATNSSYSATQEGDIDLIATSGGCPLQSNSITIAFFSVPVVNLNPSIDTSFCTGDSILLTGASGGTLQWYVDGNPISGATSSTFYASSPGFYNMTKTNMNGCIDSSAVGINIVEITDCDAGLFDNTFNSSVKLYPSPTEDLLGISVDVLNAGELVVEVYSLDGTLVKSSIYNTSIGNNTLTIPTAHLGSGMYIVTLQQDGSNWSQRFVKK